MTNSVTMPAKELANASKAYVALEMLKLRLRMKPAPKVIDTTRLQRNGPTMRNDPLIEA